MPLTVITIKNVPQSLREWAEDIDMKKALSEKARAEDWLTRNADENPLYVERARIAIQKSITRMNVSQGGSRSKR